MKTPDARGPRERHPLPCVDQRQPGAKAASLESSFLGTDPSARPAAPIPTHPPEEHP